jgi:CTP:molybdopterin cytidylyltransferase MocA
MRCSKIGVVIVAGGLSSRMKDFKPLLSIGKRSMIETTINNFRSVGADEIVVVTGYRANDIEGRLNNSNIKFVRNENYEFTQMFDSVCIGLKELKQRVSMIFVTPADSPFVQKFTLKKMIKEMGNSDLKALQPSYKNMNGHPLLLSSDAVGEILNHDGTNGLHGVIDKFKDSYVNLSFVDPGIILDADTPEDYLKLIEYNENKDIPDVELCLKIQDYFNVPGNVREHSIKVAMTAVGICGHLLKKGVVLDRKIIVAASMLHDIAKGIHDHSKVGALRLLDMGYDRVSEIVRTHMKLEYIPEIITEKEVVYLADKMVQRITPVSIEDRFAAKEEFYKHDEDILSNIEEKKKLTVNLYNKIFNN